MGYFTSLGMSFAVDDVGAGHSGSHDREAQAQLPEDRHRTRARRPRERVQPPDGEGPHRPRPRHRGRGAAEGIEKRRRPRSSAGSRRLRAGLPPRQTRRRPGAGLRTRSALFRQEAHLARPSRSSSPWRAPLPQDALAVHGGEVRRAEVHDHPGLAAPLERAWRRDTRGSSTRIATSSSRPPRAPRRRGGTHLSAVPPLPDEARAGLTGRPAARRGPPRPARRCR